MLRLPKFEVALPESLDEALTLLAEHGDDVQILAGGTDLVPNMKHELFTPKLVLSLARIPGLSGIRSEPDGTLVIGAMTTIDALARDPLVQKEAPALAQAASLIAGPQLRRMGTLGGNVMLDTRCQWYNQTYFWRSALGFCLKKDGTLCHVVEGGSACVAAASNDTAPALMTLNARAVFHGPEPRTPDRSPVTERSIERSNGESRSGRREIALDELFLSDGIYNKKVKGEILTEVQVPPRARGHRGAYGKLRTRGSIDFPLLGIAVRLDLDPLGAVQDADVAAVALQARPVRVKKVGAALQGTRPGTSAFTEAVQRCAELAEKQCHPLPNVPGDHEYRHAMVPVYVRRTLAAAAEGTGPVHHL